VDVSIVSVEEHEVYSAIGEQGFQALIAAFYSQIPQDEVLGRMYPPEDLAGAEKRLRDFLIFRFGGPQRYVEERGHPRLRMRHAPFPVNEIARQHWLRMMGKALQETDIPEDAKHVLWAYFESTAAAMVNRG
jgi:hemoglobin